MIIELKYTYELSDNDLKNIVNDYYNHIDRYDFFMDKNQTIKNIIDTLYDDDDIFHFMDNDYVIKMEIGNENETRKELKNIFSKYYDELYNEWCDNINNDYNNGNDDEIEELKRKITMLENEIKKLKR